MGGGGGGGVYTFTHLFIRFKKRVIKEPLFLQKESEGNIINIFINKTHSIIFIQQLL